MYKYIRVQNGVVVSIQESNNPVISDDLSLIDEDVKVEIGDLFLDGAITKKNISSEIEERTTLIKQEAANRITATDWELQRVEERKTRNKKSQADIDVVLDMRDKIRTDSDLAEISVLALTTIEEVKAFRW